jgi:hypothetical protein
MVFTDCEVKDQTPPLEGKIQDQKDSSQTTKDTEKSLPKIELSKRGVLNT